MVSNVITFVNQYFILHFYLMQLLLSEFYFIWKYFLQKIHKFSSKLGQAQEIKFHLSSNFVNIFKWKFDQPKESTINCYFETKKNPFNGAAYFLIVIDYRGRQF
jgi:hypothetical protein